MIITIPLFFLEIKMIRIWVIIFDLSFLFAREKGVTSWTLEWALCR